MKKFGVVVGALIAVAALVAIVFFGRQHQAATLRSQAASHSSLVAKKAPSASSNSAVDSSSESSSQTSKSTSKKIGKGQSLTYVALGDSLAAGDYTTKENLAYQYVLTRYLKNDLGFKAKLDGYWEAGATITSIAQPNYESIVAMKPDLITIELGTNEQDQSNANYAQSATFKTNLINLIDGFQKDLPQAKIVLMTTWQTETSSTYDAVIQAVGSQYKLPVVDISSVWQDSNNIAQSGATSWTGSGDGYHPNDAGNQAIAKLLEKAVTKLYQ